jgi:hypothetical protein
VIIYMTKHAQPVASAPQRVPLVIDLTEEMIDAGASAIRRETSYYTYDADPQEIARQVFQAMCDARCL